MDRTKDYRNIVQQRINSGKSVKDFCADRGIRPSLCYYWHKKQAEQKESKFHHIKLSFTGPGAGMRILYPNGVQAELYGEVNLAQIKTLIDVGLIRFCRSALKECSVAIPDLNLALILEMY